MAGDTIGRAEYELGANAEKLETALKTADSRIKSSGETVERQFGAKASAGFDHAGKSAGRFGGLMDGLAGKTSKLGSVTAVAVGGLATGAVLGGIGLVTGAITTLVGSLGEAQDAYREDLGSQARLAAALKANVAAWDGNTDAIEKTIAARMDLGFADEEQRASLAELVARTHDVDEALKLQATAMDLARLKGISLSQASQLLGKVWSGQVTALNRAGVAVDKNATSTEALAAVQKAAAGQAEAYARTQGKQEISQLKAGEAMERVGEIVARVADVVMPALAGALVAVVDGIGKFVAENKGLFDVLGAIAGFIGTVLGAALEQLAHNFTMAFGVVQTVVGAAFDAVRFVVSGIIGAIRNVMDIAAQIPGPWQDGAREVAAALDDMQSNVESWGRSTTQTAQATGSAVPGAVAGPIAAGASTVAGAAEEGITDPIEEAAEAGTAAAAAEAAKTPQEVAKELQAGRFSVKEAWESINDVAKTTLSKQKEIAELEAFLTSDKMTKGLRSKRPEVRAEYEAWRAAAKERLFALRNDVPGIAQRTGQSYADVLASKKKEAGLAGAGIAAAARNKLRIDLTGAGNAAGWSWVQGLSANEAKAKAAAQQIAFAVRDILGHSVPKEGPLRNLETWGIHAAANFAKGLASGSGVVHQSALTLAAAPRAVLAPGASAPVSASSVTHARTWAGDLNVHVHATIGSVDDAADVRRLGRELGEEIRLSLANGPLLHPRGQ